METAKEIVLTKGERATLESVIASMNEDNHSEYTKVPSKEEKGYLGSLVKKGLVFDTYEGMDMGIMYCATRSGLKLGEKLGVDTSHINLDAVESEFEEDSPETPKPAIFPLNTDCQKLIKQLSDGGILNLLNEALVELTGNESRAEMEAILQSKVNDETIDEVLIIIELDSE